MIRSPTGNRGSVVKRLLAALIFACLASSGAMAQCLPGGSLPPGTVVGRLPGGAGPCEAIPFSLLFGYGLLVPGTEQISPVTNGGLLWDNNGILADSLAPIQTALPNLTTSQIYGGTGVAGVAQAFPLGTGLATPLTQPINATGGLVGYGGAMGNVTGHASLDAPLASPTFTGTITAPDAGTWGSGGINGSTINGSAIGGTTPAAGSFTTLAASSAVSGAGFSTYLASPPAIGGTAPGAGTFNALSLTNSQNTTTAFAVSNTNAGSSASAQLRITSNIGTLELYADSTAFDNTMGFYTSFSGGMSFWAAGGPLTFLSNNVTALTLGTSQQATFAAHILASSTSPGISSCGTGSPAVVGSDNFLKITAGGGTLTSCVVNFGKTWGTAPVCTVSSTTSLAAVTVTTSTTQLTLGATSLTSAVVNAVCGSLSELEPANDNRDVLDIAA